MAPSTSKLTAESRGSRSGSGSGSSSGPKKSTKQSLTRQAPLPTKTKPIKSHAYIVDQLYNLHIKLAFPKFIKNTFLEYDQVQASHLDEDSFLRKIRLSQIHRAEFTRIITQSMSLMMKEPAEEHEKYASLIKKCTELLELSDKPKDERTFPIRKLPTEIRERIYFYLYRITYSRAMTYLPPTPPSSHPKTTPDLCPSKQCPYPKGERSPNNPRGYIPTLRPIDLSLAKTSKTMNQEILTYLSRNKLLNFTCTCCLLLFLRSHPSILPSIRSLSLHFRGPSSPAAFTRLKKCVNLDTLKVKISQATTYQLNDREMAMQKYFKGNKKVERLSDARGLDELLEVRGVREVKVVSAVGRVDGKRTKEEVERLGALLRDVITGEREEGYGEDRENEDDE